MTVEMIVRRTCSSCGAVHVRSAGAKGPSAWLSMSLWRGDDSAARAVTFQLCETCGFELTRQYGSVDPRLLTNLRTPVGAQAPQKEVST